jgi:hypothetical protein
LARAAAATVSRFFEPLQSDDLARVQDLIDKGFDKVEDGALLAANVVANVAIRVVDTPVFHGLGRPIRGYLVVRSNALATTCEGATSTNPSLFVNIKASVAVTATLLFF